MPSIDPEEVHLLASTVIELDKLVAEADGAPGTTDAQNRINKVTLAAIKQIHRALKAGVAFDER